MSEIVPSTTTTMSLIADDDVPALMKQIRPEWQARGLIERVRKLLPVDLSSACQRLLNAAIQDLREKIKIAGLDIAEEAAKLHKLPPVRTDDDVDNYSTARIIDLAYRMGLLTRPEWRRLSRAYEIRRDLEHEDSEYEAGIEDAVYIFRVAIESVLSKDPVQLVRVTDVKEVVEAPGPAVANDELIEDFEHAPDTRQIDILKFVLSRALDDDETDVVRTNAFNVLGALSAVARDAVRLEVGRHLQDKVGRRGLTDVEVRAAQQGRIFVYLRKAQKRAFFKNLYARMALIGPGWRSHSSHGDLLRIIVDTGGLATITEEELPEYVKWMTLCFIGEPGGYGAGVGRAVFFSNSGVRIIVQLFEEAPDLVRPIVVALAKDKDVKAARARSAHVSRRYDELLDLIEPS